MSTAHRSFCDWHELCNSLPPWKAVDEASESQAGGIAYYWGKRGGEGHGPQNEPPSSQIFPSLSQWFQRCKYFFAEDKEQYGKGDGDDASKDRQGQLDRSHSLDHLEQSAP